MASQSQIDANRRNAQKSTGPRTPQGKDRSSRNSLIHGLTAKKHFLPDEDPADLADLLERFRAEWRPATETQESLVERMAAAHWRLRHFVALEAGIFNLTLEISPLPGQFNQQGRTDPMAWAFHVNCMQGDHFSRLARYEAHLQRDFSRCLRELQKLQAGPPAETEAPGVSLEINGDGANPTAQDGAREVQPPPPGPKAPNPPIQENCEENPISEDRSRDAHPRGTPQPPAPRPLSPREDPISYLGPPPRWTDFAPEVKIGSRPLTESKP